MSEGAGIGLVDGAREAAAPGGVAVGLDLLTEADAGGFLTPPSGRTARSVQRGARTRQLERSRHPNAHSTRRGRRNDSPNRQSDG
jgi:hypothetical protein